MVPYLKLELTDGAFTCGIENPGLYPKQYISEIPSIEPIAPLLFEQTLRRGTQRPDLME